MSAHNDFGKYGEAIALSFLKKKGYGILHTNWRYSRAEVDIIAKKNDVIVFIEVKSRSSQDFGAPEESVSFQKQSLLTKAANAYLEEYNLDLEVRFDIITVLKQSDNYTINHIEDAFFLVE